MKMESKIKNVIIVCDHMHVAGGASKIAIQTAKGLKAQGLNVVYFGAVRPISDDLLINGIDVYCTQQTEALKARSKVKGFFQGLSNSTALKMLDNVLTQYSNEDTIVHIHSWTKALSSSILVSLAKRGFNTVITLHDYFLICPNGGLFNYKKAKICSIPPMSFKCAICNCDSRNYFFKIYRLLRQKIQERRIIRNKKIYYIFISQFSRDQFQKRSIPIERPHCYFLRNPIQFRKDRERIQCEKNTKYAYIGALYTAKGIRNFCDAVTSVGVDAIVVGDGKLFNALKADYSNIDFVGWKSKTEIDVILKDVRCLIFPSIWYEAAPLTPLEVMAYGIPVICSDLNAAKDYITEESGWLYSGDDIEDLKSAIVDSLDDQSLLTRSERLFHDFDDAIYNEVTYVHNLECIYADIMRKTCQK